MSDLIDRQNLREQLNELCDKKCPYNEPTKAIGACCSSCAIDDVIEMVQQLPSAQTEQKTGKWIVDDEYIDCSCCRREKWSRTPYEQLVSRFRFCPNCGAKMEDE